MQTINPQRLRQLREEKGLSRSRLALETKISERQIARIESASGGAESVRQRTLSALAEALEVEPSDLSSTEPLPNAEAEGVGQSALVDPQRIKALRKGKSMSRVKLAERSKVSLRQIARIESSATRVRRTTLNRLAKALGTDLETLTGEDPINPEPPVPPKVRIGVKTHPQLSLAYDLVCHRYGLSRNDIFESAPLLFTLLAEASLAWRRQCLKEVEEAKDRMVGLAKTSQLYFAKYVLDLESGIEMERESICEADLVGDKIRADGDHMTFCDWLYEVAPFADYLCKLANDLEISGKVDFPLAAPFSATVGWGIKSYQVCRNELEEITGKSEGACSALVHGDVKLSDIPKELMAPEAKEQRTAWLERRESEQHKQQREEFNQLSKEFEELLETRNQEGGEHNG